MRFGVTTEELQASASTLRGDADVVARLTAPLTAAGEASAGWSVGRARRAGQAFFDTLARASEDAETGLRELGGQVTTAAGEYAELESRLSVTP
jgi:uncharacterized protein YukE